jgi:hypothetical protein
LCCLPVDFFPSHVVVRGLSLNFVRPCHIGAFL